MRPTILPLLGVLTACGSPFSTSDPSLGDDAQAPDGPTGDARTADDGGAAEAASDSASPDGLGEASGDDAGATDGCVLVTHDNGLGPTWQDCAPLGTYNPQEAWAACNASYDGGCLLSPTDCQNVASVFVYTAMNEGVYWVYDHGSSTAVEAGEVLVIVYPFTCPQWPGRSWTWK